MLTITQDPAGITGVQRFEWDYGASIQANMERHLDDGSECEVRVNGSLIDPAGDGTWRSVSVTPRCRMIADLVSGSSNRKPS